MLTTTVNIKNPFRKESKDEANKRGRQAAFKLISEYATDGIGRKEAAQRLFALSNGECNTTDAERWFDEGLRAQLNDLGFEEE